MKYQIMTLLLFLLIGCQNINSNVTTLKLVKALPVEYHESIEPSGLTSYDGVFYTISDDHDNFIFKLEIYEDKVVLNPEIKFEPPPMEGFNKFDFEGITCDNDGNFYLSSENTLQILRVSREGEKVSWLFESVKRYGETKGLFQIENANLEGIAWLGNNQFVLCAERQPRGILSLNLSENPPNIDVYNLNQTNVELQEPRFPDFTGLFVEGGDIWVLERAACRITKIEFQKDNVKLLQSWSYESIEMSDSLRYSDTLFTCGEGVCMDANYVYVILDNNRNPRLLDPEDRRPLLLIMERP